MKNSTVSRVSSTRSSISIARVEESAKMAELEVEAKVLKQKQALQEKERRLNEDQLKLTLEKEELLLKTELAKAQARESIFAQAEAAAIQTETLDHKSNEKVPLETLNIPQENLSGRVTNSKAIKSEARSSKKIKESPYDYERQKEQLQDKIQRSHITLPKKKRIGIGERDETTLREIYDKDHGIFHRQNRILEEMVIQQQRTTLPHRSMMSFSGDVTQYRTFCQAFETLIEVKEPDPASKLYYLEQFTTGRAQELVRSCLHMAPNEGYKKARALLDQKFGQKHSIATAHIDQLIKGNPIKAEDGDALEQFSIQLISCSNTLKAIGCMNKIENPDAMRKLIERLPYKLQERWRDTADRIMNDERREITIEDISKFVERRARSLNNPVFGKLSFPSKDQYPKSRLSKLRQTSGHKPSSFATQVRDKDLKLDLPNLNPSRAEAGIQTENAKMCLCCDKNHKLTDCPGFEKRPYAQRLDFAKKHRLCFACLNGGHQSKTCFKRKPCKICSGKHSTLLHYQRHPAHDDTIKRQEESKDGKDEDLQKVNSRCGFATTGGSVTALPVVPVKVRKRGSSEYVETYAMLDSGSNSTFCTDSLRERLGCSGTEKKVKLTTLGTSQDVISIMLTDLEVTDLDENNAISLPEVLCRPSIPVSKDEIPTQEDADRWQYLQGHVYLPTINAKVELLIGANVPQALQPKQIIGSQDGGPYATKVALGWIINGPVGRKLGKAMHASFFTRTEVHPMCAACSDFLDASDINENVMSRNDQRFMNIVESSVKKTSDNH